MNHGEIQAGLAPTPNYRYADRVGERLFVAGQVPLDVDGQLVGLGDVRAQAQRCLDNLFLLVSHHGFDVADIHQLTVYVVGEHQNLLDAWQQVTAGFGGEVPPATLLGVTFLGYANQSVEIDAVVCR